MNILLNTDSYKTSHWLQYPPGTTMVSSYIEARGMSKDNPIAAIPSATPKEIVHFGLQAFIQKYLLDAFTQADIDEAASVLSAHGVPFNREGWEYILKEHDGHLPLFIQGLPEGTPVPIGTAQAQIINTDQKVPWLTSYVETMLLRAVWYPSTVATISREAKKVIQAHLLFSADTLDTLPFKLHDFGARGASSEESAALGGMAHLVNFMGTDTLSAIQAADEFYDAGMAGYSIPAAEHSTITAWGKENEKEAYRNMIRYFSGPKKVYAVVSDSYDIYNAVDRIWGVELHDEVVNSGGTLVIRPDSGDPAAVLKRVFSILGNRFGYRINSKNFKVLPPYLRVIQGDGVNPLSINSILTELAANGWSAENLAFGMGGALLQKVDRDTFKYAMKASSALVGGEWRDVYKDPVTDEGKKSKRGVLEVVKRNGRIETVRDNDVTFDDRRMFRPIYINGTSETRFTFAEVRDNARLESKVDCCEPAY